MKLGRLKTAIRNISGAPSITVAVPNGGSLRLNVQKISILDALGDAFEGVRGAETGLRVTPEGEVAHEDGALWSFDRESGEAGTPDSEGGVVELEDDLDDLLS